MAKKPEPVPFHNVPVEAFPFTVEFIRESDGEILHSTTVEGPGALLIPGLGLEPKTVRITYATGIFHVRDSSGHVWEGLV